MRVNGRTLVLFQFGPHEKGIDRGMLVVWTLVFCVPWLIVLVRGAMGAASPLAMFCVAELCFFAPCLWSINTAEHNDGLGVLLVPLIVGVAAPLLNPVIVVSWALGAPLIGFASLAIGLSVAVFVGWLAWRCGVKRAAAVTAFCTLALVAWAVSEVAVTATLAAQARRQFPDGYCISERRSVLGMIENGEANLMTSRHAGLVSDGRGYYWSFQANRWLLSGPQQAKPVRACEAA